MDFSSAPFGSTGLETALISLYTHFIEPGRFGWDLLVKTYAAEPRRMLNLDLTDIKPGHRAEFLVFDPEASTTVNRDFIQSKSTNTPFLDQTLKGSVEKVVSGPTILLDREQANRASLSEVSV
ncbi:MAG: hypothetical protein AAF492_01840, partial [Verrucomicrobiota bacterium]